MQGMEDRIAPPQHFATSLDEAHALAARKYGADDFGSGDYLAGLRVLLLSMDYDPHFTPRGRAIAWGSIMDTLAARAFAVRAMKQTPGFDSHAIAAPIVITGMPRTGTTALHKLMAIDPQFQGLQGWLMTAPMPRPPRASWEGNPLFLEAVERLEIRFAAMPGRRAAHDMAAEEVDECLGILRQGFVSNLWCCGWSAPSYDIWWQTQDELPSYRWLHRVYQLIGAHEPDKIWLLKNPGHVDNLDSLFTVFPDAKVIQTHRDPARAVPSLCSLLMKNHRVMEDGPDDVRARLMCVRETEKWAGAIRRAEPVRQAHAGQILDVVHRDFHAAPMATIERIYAFAGLKLTPQVRAAMEARIAQAPETSHGEHRYAIADYGMTEDAIRERFGNYVERFDLA
ncbi:MAG TPA: sulfotransferase [Sphingobium sp.]|nr:sulfotransferase [Sphingobium sp.]